MKHKISFSSIIKIVLVVMVGVFVVSISVGHALADDVPTIARLGADTQPNPTNPNDVPIITIPGAVTQSSPSSVADLVSRVIALLGWVVGASSGIGLLVGALLYIISAGDPGKTRTAKDAIVYSIVGLAVALLSYGVVTFVLGKKS